jgi:Double zinc ribbon
MQCSRCHAENRPSRRFCGECGLLLALACPACGFLNEGSERFCGGCGALLAETSMGAETKFQSPDLYTPKHLKSALEGERKQVTVLFADLKGSMEMLAEQTVPAHQQTRASPGASGHRDDDVPRDGHAVLAGEGGGGDE